MDIPETLREKLAAGRVIPFVGTGVSMAVHHKESNERIFPSWSELLYHSADRLERESKQPMQILSRNGRQSECHAFAHKRISGRPSKEEATVGYCGETSQGADKSSYSLYTSIVYLMEHRHLACVSSGMMLEYDFDFKECSSDTSA